METFVLWIHTIWFWLLNMVKDDEVEKTDKWKSHKLLPRTDQHIGISLKWGKAFL